MSGEEIAPYWIKDSAYTSLKRNPQLFEALIQIALQYANIKNKIVKISAFNEWGFGLEIEPSQEDGFIYLQILAKYLNEKK